MKKNKFSIVVCAYNASSRLPRTLEHLANLKYIGDHVEIIIVDNNSNDGTSDLTTTVWRKLGSPFKLTVLHEERQGKSHALKKAILASKYELMLICDDDNWLNNDYLHIANEIIENNSSIGILGGQGVPVIDSNSFPNWFYTYAGGYATGVQGMESGDISNRGYVWGASSIVKRPFLEKALTLGLNFLLTGRNGGNLMSGEDSEICKWYLIAGYKLWYDERLVFKHYLPEQRLTQEYLKKLYQGFFYATEILSEYDEWIRRDKLRASGWSSPQYRIKAEINYILKNSKIKKEVRRTANLLKNFRLNE